MSNRSIADAAVATIKTASTTYSKWESTRYAHVEVTAWWKFLDLMRGISDVPPEPVKAYSPSPIFLALRITESSPFQRSRDSAPVLKMAAEGVLHTYEVFIDAKSIGKVTSDVYAKVAFNTPPLTDGVHIVTGVDVNTGTKLIPTAFEIKTSSPADPIISSVDVVSGQIVIRGTVEDNDTYQLYVYENLSFRGGGSINPDRTYFANAGKHSPGTYVIRVVAVDAFGNQSPGVSTDPITII